jgi:hypothetical protein
MGVRTFAVAGFTTDAVADTSDLTDNKFMAVKGGSSTQLTKIKEVRGAGLESSTSAPQKLLLSRDSTVGTSPTALSTGESDEEDNPSTSVLSSPVVTYTAAGSTQPQRAKKYLANLAFNALGGIFRERFPFGEEPCILGNTADDGEVSLSGFTGTTAGLVGAHIKYETV